MAREHPAFPSVKHVRTAGSGDVWVSEVIFDYGTGDPPWRVCSIIEFSGDRIGRVTEYFGQPFEAPAWRAPFTERIPEGG
jgi:hypothetical protein